MRSYNRIFLIGNCAAEPILGEGKTGTYLYFPIAIERKSKKEDKEVDYHRVIVWGEIGTKFKTMIAKGTRLFVTGELKNHKYESQNEIKHITEVHASQIEILSKNKNKTKITENQELVTA